MPKLLLAVVLAACLPGCTSTSDSRSSALDEVGSSIGGFSRSTDTLGTNQRRMDTYGGTTAPVLPTIGNAGFGR